MQLIGMIGGLSWESSAGYYRIINRPVQQRLGGVHSARTLMYAFDFGEIESLQHDGDWQAATRLMIDAAQRLERGGADFMLICSNTMHRMADDVAAAVSIPPLHIADATATRINAAGVSRVGLLGTAFTPNKSLAALEQLGLDPWLADELYAMFRNTANVTIVNAGKTINVVPSEASARVDARLVPGATDRSFLAELKAVIGNGYSTTVDQYSAALESRPESELYDVIRDAVAAHDPGAHVVPYLVVGGTDARHIKRKFDSVICGFKPMRQEPEAPRQALVHGHEPVDYGPLRLLQAAERICTVAGPKVSPRVRELMNRLVVEIPRHAARRNGDPEGYVRFLDDSCRSLASTLMTYHDVERRES